MASNTRAKKSGINADMQKKREATYPKADEETARKWIEELLGEKLGDDFFEALKDGSKLNKLLNTLQPGTVAAKATREAKTPFAQIDNISAFLSGCEKYGMKKEDLFVTVDLHEQQNKNMVIASLFSLGRQAQKNGFNGPVIGPKEAESQPREFSEEQLREGRNITNTIQMGTNQVASQQGMTPYGHARQIA